MTKKDNGSVTPSNPAGAESGGLVEALLAHVAEDVRRGLGERGGLAAELVGMQVEGQQAWPQVVLDALTLARHLARHLKPETDLRRLDAPGLYLAAACAEGNPAALQALDGVLRPLAARVVQRLNRSHVTVEELVATARARLLQQDATGTPRMAGFNGVGGLESWLQAVLTRAALAPRARTRA